MGLCEDFSNREANSANYHHHLLPTTPGTKSKQWWRCRSTFGGRIEAPPILEFRRIRGNSENIPAELGFGPAKMIPLFMVFAGGPLGSGRQWFSWIHLDDIVNLIYEALSNPSYKGVINGTAPNPVRFAEMCEHLGNVLGRPSWLPVPDFALKAVLGEGASVVLDGQRVLPVRAEELGFSFKYSYVRDALQSIISQKVA